MNPILADAARRLLGIPPGSRLTAERRAARLQRLADVLDVLALWPRMRRTRGVHPMELEVARAEMALRDEPETEARRLAALREFMVLAADRYWTQFDWRAPAPPPPPHPGITDADIRRRDIIRAALGEDTRSD